MSNPYFSFKQFTVRHDRCAMKVGTDGVLLGAWTEVTNAHHILDIGTGTGLIALMLAQRTASSSVEGPSVTGASILAVDIDEAAVGQALENVAASPWASRIRVERQDVCQMEAGELFDLIVSNPPYYNSLKCPDAQRHTARHTDSLSFNELAAAVDRMLAPDGRFAVVIPTDAVPQFLAATAEHDLFPCRHTLVRTKQGVPAKRSLLEFLRRVTHYEVEELLLEDAPGQRSAQYKALAGEFYLK
jgi:tRNA1Val (adenine37-N6)-methyltransferase